MAETDWTVQHLLALSDSYWQTAALHAGVELDLFTLLDGAAMTAGDLARQAGCDRRALEMLLEALAAMGLLAVSAAGYASVPAARRWLSRSSAEYQGYIMRHHHHLMAFWARLPAAVRGGGPVWDPGAVGEAEWREAFLLGMFNIASLRAPQVAKQLDLSGRRRLLDLGGGPGTYACHFCLVNPGLRATVFDLPTSREFAEQTRARFELESRVAFVPGNFLEDPIPGRYDVAWLSQILHSEGPAACARILEAAVAALEPGGMLLIQEFILDDDRPGPLFPALFSLNMLLGTDRGRSYRESELRSMLEQAGLRQVRRLLPELPGPAGIIAGVL